MFTNRVIGIGDGGRKRIGKDSRRFIEGNAVLLQVRNGLALVPSELHSGNGNPFQSAGLTLELTRR